MSRMSDLAHGLYEGRVSYDFIGRRRRWYVVSVLIVVACLAGVLVRGFNFGIEFRGGVEFTAQVAKADTATVDRLTQAIVDVNIPETGSPTAVTSGDSAVRLSTQPLTQAQADEVEKALSDAGATEVSQNLIGPTWGAQVAEKAVTGLVVFLVFVVLFISIYFREWKMSAGAMLALAHDVIITVGVYAWSGFEVTPSTVTGLLTILGYSLYDTVVVYDKVRENTRGYLQLTNRTYAESSNLAINQTLVRSINTSVTALLPVAALLVVGVGVLGNGPLKDLALALFVGMAAGAYSSIFIAVPFTSQLKEREPQVKAQAERVLAKRAKQAAAAEAGDDVTAAPARTVTASGASKRAQPQRTTRSQRPRNPRS